MALDGLVLRAVVHELQSCAGARINKIHQPSEHDIVMHLRAQGRNVRLLLSANPTYPRLHVTEQTFINPLEAPMFCMLLRKHCEGGILEAVEQVGNERIVRLAVRQRDELGDISVKTLVMEIMGRHSNLILTDPASATIIDGIHHVTPAISSYRIVMPGSKYTAPPEQHKLDPLAVAAGDFAAALAAHNGQPLKAALVGAFSGLSPLIAAEIVHRSGLSSATEAPAGTDALWPAFAALMDDMRAHRYTPVIVAAAGSGKSFFAVTPLTHIAGQADSFAAPSACLEAFYGAKAERDTVKQRVADLLRFLQNEKNKNEKKLDKLQETLAESKDADKQRILGELLTASLHTVQKGDKELETVDYYDEHLPLVRIPLDPLLTPSENAQRYFKKYTKMKNSAVVVEEQITQTHTEIAYLSSLLQQLDAATLLDIEEIRDELMEMGYIRDRHKKQRKKKKQTKPMLACYTSSEGVPIYVGKNNTQNEYLTNRLAAASDTWLHTKDIPGSHVVIRGDGYSEQTLLEAARLAAYFSQAKESSQVPVDYTLIRHVHKPSGAKPGFVIYINQKTLFVTPEEQHIKTMPMTVK